MNIDVLKIKLYFSSIFHESFQLSILLSFLSSVDVAFLGEEMVGTRCRWPSLRVAHFLLLDLGGAALCLLHLYKRTWLGSLSVAVVLCHLLTNKPQYIRFWSSVL